MSLSKVVECETTLNGEYVNLLFEYEDTSFAHAFGTQVQGHWQLLSVLDEAGQDITDMLCSMELDKLDNSAPRYAPTEDF